MRRSWDAEVGAEYGGTLTVIRSGNAGELQFYTAHGGLTFPAWESTPVGEWPADLPLPAWTGVTVSDGTRGYATGLQLRVDSETRRITVYSRNNQDMGMNQATIACQLYW